MSLSLGKEIEPVVRSDDRRSTRAGPTQSGLLWLALTAIGMVVFFWDGLVSLGAAWARPEYSYGPLVPLITGYMTLREYHHHPVTPNNDSGLPGLLMVAVGMFLGLLGNVSKIPDITTYGFIVTIGGLVLILAGWRQGLRFWPGWFHLVFMLPLPNILYWPLSIKLQSISSILGVELISSLGIPVYLDGNIIDLGIYKLQVAEACSGLRYLFPLMSFGWLFAVLYNGPFWHRCVLFLSTIPITILMNSFRIGVIGVLVSQYGIEQAEGFLHAFEGWIIFVACVIVLFIEAWVLQKLTLRPRPVSEIIDIDFEGVWGPISKLPRLLVRPTFVAATIAVLVAGLLWQLTPQRAAVTVERLQFSSFPTYIEDWRGRSSILDTNIERVLGADDYLLVDYSRDDTPGVNLFVSFYDATTGGSGIHSPEVCIPSGGWEVSRWTQFPLSIGTEKFAVNRAIIQKGVQRQLVYYWFDQRGHRLTNDYIAKIYTVWDSLIYGRSDGALVRVVTPIALGEADSSADKRLAVFLGSVLPVLPKYVPDA